MVDGVTGGDLDSIVKGAMPPSSSVDFPKVKAGLMAATEQEAKASAGIAGRMGSDVNRDLSRVHKAEAGIEPVPDMKWDADAERKKYTTDPMAALGSLGAVAVMLASAFTRQPMINTLNSAGAYLGAVNDVNNRNYDKAYEAFKENANLAFKRHETQRESFQDALELMKTDISAGKAMLEANAVRFGDQRRLALAQGGYFKDLIDLQNHDQEMALKWTEHMGEIDKAKAQRDAYQQKLDQTGDKFTAWHDVYAPAYSTTMGHLAAEYARDREAELTAAGKSPAEAKKQALEEAASLNHPNMAPKIAAQKLLDEGFSELEKDTGIKLPPELRAGVMSVMADGNAKSEPAKMAFTAAMQEIRLMKAKGLPVDANTAANIIRNQMANVQTGQEHKIDQGIINELDHYKGKGDYPPTERKDLGFILPQKQIQLEGALRSSQASEEAAKFVVDHPNSVGLLADAAVTTNWDAYQGLFKDFERLWSNGAIKDGADVEKFANAAAESFDKKIDDAARSKGLTQQDAQDAKVLNKLTATLAFADAASFGGRPTIYLDKQFRTFYQQASTLPTFFEILSRRENDANRTLEIYKMGLDRRDDYEKNFGFHYNPGKYLQEAEQNRLGPNQTQTLPATRAEMKDGATYSTNKGPMIWDSNAIDPKTRQSGALVTKQEWDQTHAR